MTARRRTHRQIQVEKRSKRDGKDLIIAAFLQDLGDDAGADVGGDMSETSVEIKGVFWLVDIIAAVTTTLPLTISPTFLARLVCGLRSTFLPSSSASLQHPAVYYPANQRPPILIIKELDQISVNDLLSIAKKKWLYLVTLSVQKARKLGIG